MSAISSTETAMGSTITTTISATMSAGKATMATKATGIIIGISYARSERNNDEEEEECLVHLGVVSWKLVMVIAVGRFI